MKIAALQTTNPFSGITVPSSGGAINPNNTTVGEVVSAVLPYIFGAVGLLLLVYLALGGLQLMTSRGDPKAVAAAQAKITNALIGFIIVIVAAAIVLLLGNLLRINIFTGLIKWI